MQYESAAGEMEFALVGSLILSPEELPRVAALLRPDDFQNKQARLVYETIRFLGADGRPADLVLIVDDLRRRGELDEAGGAVGITAFTEAAISGANAQHYAEKVADASRERKQRAAIEAAYLAIDGGEKAAAVVAELRSDLETAEMSGGRNLEARPIAEVIAECLRNEAPAAAITTGYEQWDLLHGGGLATGDVTVIGAAPSIGKSQFAINLEARMRRSGAPARSLHVSMEMTARDITARFIAMLGGMNTVTARTMLRGSARDYTWENYGWSFEAGRQLAEKLSVKTVYGAFKPEDLAALAARYAGRIDVMVVDYLQLVAGEKNQKTLDRVAAASRACKQIALANDIHVIAISSLNRDGYRHDAKPTLASLRETGNIEFDADNVWLLWRKKEPGANVEDLEADIVKQRNGPLDMIAFRFELASGIIAEKGKGDEA
jgi:replicative DNA helicase